MIVFTILFCGVLKVSAKILTLKKSSKEKNVFPIRIRIIGNLRSERKLNERILLLPPKLFKKSFVSTIFLLSV